MIGLRETGGIDGERAGARVRSWFRGERPPTTRSSIANATAARWHTDDGIYLLSGLASSRRTGTRDTGQFSRSVPPCCRCLGSRPAEHHRPAPSGAPPVSGSVVDYRAHYRPATIVRMSGASPAAGQTTKPSPSSEPSATSARPRDRGADRHPHCRFLQQRSPAPETAGKDNRRHRGVRAGARRRSQSGLRLETRATCCSPRTPRSTSRTRCWFAPLPTGCPKARGISLAAPLVPAQRPGRSKSKAAHGRRNREAGRAGNLAVPRPVSTGASRLHQRLVGFPASYAPGPH